MTDRVAIVTGGSGAIGAATCRALSAAGHHVLVGYATGDKAAQKVAASCDGPAEAIALDVGSADQIDVAVDRARELGDLAALVHAGGVTGDALLLRLDEDTWRTTIAVNLDGFYRTSRAVLRPMLRARHGRIVAITSVVGLRGNAGQTAYAAAKAGLVGFTKSLAREVASKGVTVNAVAPGLVDSAMTADLGDAARDALLDASPLGRPVRSEEVAAAVRFLASDEAAAVTGAVLPVDGGAAM